MLIEQHQIDELQRRINYKFSDPMRLVYGFTDYLHHFFYVKRKSLFREYSLQPHDKPQVLSIQEHQQRLRDYRKSLGEYVNSALVESGYDSPELERYLAYILGEGQLLKKLSQNFWLIREQDTDFAEAQMLFIMQAIYQDSASNGDTSQFQTWLREHLQPFIEAAVQVDGRTGCQLIQEVNALKDLNQLRQQDVDELATVNQQFYDANSVLHDQLQRLQQERDSLRVQLAIAQTDRMSISHPPPCLSRPVELPSSIVRSERVQRPNFTASVLALPHAGLEVAPNLEPLRGRIPDEEDGSEYFHQYPPYILEEVRAGIAAQFKTITRKRLLPFIVTIDTDKLPSEPEPLVRVSCWAVSKALPKLDHGFYQEAVLIIEESQANSSRHRRSRLPVAQADQPLSGILAIASTRGNYDEEEGENKRVTIELILPKQDYEMHVQKWREDGGQVKLHWLYGLIPSSRMYAVCLSPPTVTFQEQFIRAELLDWPSATPTELSHSGALERLNRSQRHVVDSLVKTESGLYFLQGPPGTGKTTTAVSLLAQLRANYPNERILVCAPSNQAVRVLIFNAMQLMPDEAMALTGVAKKIPEGLEEVFVHKYAYHLYQPLILWKKQLAKEIDLSQCRHLISQIQQHHQRMLERLQRLLDTETTMVIKEKTRQGVRRLIATLNAHYQQLNAALSLYLAVANGQDTSTSVDEAKAAFTEQLEKNITCLQSNAFHLESFLIQRSPLVFATLISSGRDWLHKQITRCPIIVLDEAAQALAPEAMLPLRFNPRVYIHIGDPNQLPATIISKAGQEGGLSNSMMHWLVKEFEQPYEMLTIQYRMLAPICQWPSKQYYDGKLLTAAEVDQRPLAILNNQKLAAVFRQPSLFFDICSGQEQRYGSEVSASISNPQEAKAIVGMVCYLILKCGIDATKIGIITFYSAQLDLLQKEVKRQLRRDKSRGLVVSTVDGFQGEERDVTLVSVVRTTESVGFLNDQRRLNVAMTRAKEARWIFGFFESLSRSNSDLPSLLAQHREGGQVIDEEIFNQHVRIR